MQAITLFSLHESRDFAEKIAADLEMTLGELIERSFEDGEHKTRPLENVRNQDVYVIQTLQQDKELSVNDKLCRLLFFIGAVKDAGAASVTAVTPYLCYMRKDRKTKSRDPVTTRYIAGLFEAVGTDRIVTIDVHNLQAYQNAFRCRTEHLEAKRVFARYFTGQMPEETFAVMSPDAGGVKRAEAFRQVLQEQTGQDISLVFMEKMRSKGVISGEAVVGQVEGKSIIILDDLISSGGTMVRAARACRKKGARNVYAAATHAAFTEAANEALADKTLDQVIVTNTITDLPLRNETVQKKLNTLDIAPLFAEAIHRIHSGGSIVDLLGNE
jgi:ribose-phosphate pyrophosphokinase